MGNSFGCSASGERLVSAARDGDLVEAKMLLDSNPCLAKYSTFGGLNSPLYFAAAKGHNEIVTLLLENGADVNSRNYCGQTALMQACRYGHWEVVQTLMLFKCNVTRADYLSGRTALHFAAVNGHVRCIRLVVADFLSSEAAITDINGNDAKNNKLEQSSGGLSKFVNRAADGGLTALHMAALNGNFDCVQLLLDLQANVSAVTFHYGTSMDLIGAGSTPLHYAACGGNLKCCQILIGKRASRRALNCSGWLPLDTAKMWGRHWLEALLTPNSKEVVPNFPPSKYLSLPLMSVLNIARECGLQSSSVSDEAAETCAVCLERACSVAAEGCGHELCVRCALYLCSSSCNNMSSEPAGPPGSIPCPLCRHGITSFVKFPISPAKEITLGSTLGLCMLCDSAESNCSPTSTPPDSRVTCGPFPLASVSMCSCSDPAGCCDQADEDGDDINATSSSSPCPHLQAQPIATVEQEDKTGGGRPRTTCSNIFWGRRSCSREHQCNSEINASSYS